MSVEIDHKMLRFHICWRSGYELRIQERPRVISLLPPRTELFSPTLRESIGIH